MLYLPAQAKSAAYTELEFLAASPVLLPFASFATTASRLSLTRRLGVHASTPKAARRGRALDQLPDRADDAGEQKHASPKKRGYA